MSRSIVKQASILAIAGILVRIIGALYKSPLTALITAEGIGYYSMAYNIYALILLLSSYSIPTAISKLIAEKLALHQYNNVQKILKCSFIYICIIGGSAAIIAYLLAPVLVTGHSVLPLRILCPTIFLSGLLGVFRGYFQAHQTTFYTSISQIIEQIFNAVVAIGCAYLFVRPFMETSGSEMAAAGAAGGAVGPGVGVLVGLIFMFIMYIKNHNHLIIKDTPDDYEDSYKDIFKMIIHIVTPIIFATCVYNLITVIDQYIYSFIIGTDPQSATMWGVYSGQYIVLQNVPVALASAMSTASIPAISSSWSLKNYRETREHIRSGIRVTMMLLIPAAVGMSVLAYPIIGILFPQEETVMISTIMLAVGSPGVVFFGLSTLTNGILQAIGQVNTPLKNAAIALIYHIVITIVLLLLTPLGLYSLVIANCFYGLQVCYLNQKMLRKITHYKQEIRKTYLLPIIASLLMGVIVAIVYYGLFALTRRVLIPLILSVCIGVIVYFVIIIYFYSDHPEELSSIPYANKIIYKFKNINNKKAIGNMFYHITNSFL